VETEFSASLYRHNGKKVERSVLVVPNGEIGFTTVRKDLTWLIQIEVSPDVFLHTVAISFWRDATNPRRADSYACWNILCRDYNPTFCMMLNNFNQVASLFQSFVNDRWMRSLPDTSPYILSD
jgi:hypothetical protein